MAKPSRPEKRFLHRIQDQLILVLLISLIPTLLIQAHVFNEWYKTRRQAELQANLEIARVAGKVFETFVMDIVHSELAMGLALASRSITVEDRNRILEECKADNPTVRAIFWMNPNGFVIASSLRAYIGFDLSDRSFVREILGGKNWSLSELILGRATGKPAFTISRGIRDAQGQLLGIVAASIEPDHLDSILGVERTRGAAIALVDNKGLLVYRYPSINPSWEQRNWLRDYPEFKEVLGGQELAKTVFASYEGKNRLVGFAPIPSLGWAATAGRTEEIAMQPVISQLVPQAVLLFAITVASFGAAFLCSRFIGSSVRRLRDHARALGSGDSPNPVVASGPAELKELADSFNQMAENLRSREISLQQQREWLGVTLNSIGDAVLATDTEGKITFLNPVAEALTGWQTEEAAGQHIANVFRIINEETREPAEDIVGRVLREGCTIALINHTALVTRDGKEIPIEDSAAPIRDGAGNVSGVVLVFHDVTERRRAREALRESEERLRLLGDNLPESALYQYTHEADGSVRFLYFSAGIERLNGVGVQDILRDASTLHRQIPPEHFQKLVEAELQSSREMSDFNMEVPMHRPDGEVRWMRLHSRPRRLPAGGTIWDGVQTDVTERKKADEALRESEERFRIVQELSPDGFAILRPVRDPQGRVADFTWVYANATTERFVGMTLPSLADRSLLELFPGHYDSPFFRTYKQVAETGQLCIQEALNYGNGILAQRWFRVAVVSMGRDIAVLSQDITERRQAKEELRKSRDELELRVQERTAELETYMKKLQESNQALQDFASIASHDMQEPLRKVKTFGCRLGDKCGPVLGDEGKDYLDRMLNAAGRMQSLLDALLNYSRVTTKAEPFREVNLAELVEEVLSDLEARIEETGGHVEIGDLQKIEADPSQIRQLFQNLIGNALKYHEEEKPMVRVYGEAHNESYHIHVEDNGIGFDESNVDKIFQPFQRLHGRSSKFEGTGMGLAICKKIVERHGGSITATSRQGMGSTFTITLPVTFSSGVRTA